jgi:hypothetical protein
VSQIGLKKLRLIYVFLVSFFAFLGNLWLVFNPSLTSESISGPITVARAAPEPIP